MKKTGFTLVEVLLSVTIFSIIASSTYSVFEAQKNLSKKTAEISDKVQIARALLRLIEDDLKPSFISKNFEIYFVGQKNRVETLSTNNIPKAKLETDLTKTIYYQKEGGGIYRHKRKQVTETIFITEEDAELLHESALIEFRFYDGSNWIESFDSRLLGKLPKILAVTVTVNGEKFTKAFTPSLLGINLHEQ